MLMPLPWSQWNGGHTVLSSGMPGMRSSISPRYPSLVIVIVCNLVHTSLAWLRLAIISGSEKS